jgi:hypothetical protein
MMSTVLLILYTMPASTATTERSFSVLRRLKTYLRTTMLQDSLTSLAVLYCICTEILTLIIQNDESNEFLQ